MEGQMTKEEREFIKNSVSLCKPEFLVECGTWKGGGSTLAIGEAIHDQNKGMLYTFEQNKEIYDIAQTDFQKEHPGIAKYIKFHNDDFIEGLQRLKLLRIDFALLDGPGTRKNNCYMVKALEVVGNLMSNGGIVILHDWNKIKCEIVKSVIFCSGEWNVDAVIDTEMGICRIIKSC